MYTILKSYPIALDNLYDNNHIYIQSVANNQDYSIGINVCSNIDPHVMWYVVKEYEENVFEAESKEKEIITYITRMKEGKCWLEDEFVLSYEQQRWFTREELQLATSSKEPNNELGCRLMGIVSAAMADPNAYIVVFGQSWGPKEVEDRTFGFYPAQGIHDVHCNQYNGHMSQKRDVTEGDGALFVHFPEEKKLIGVFCLFEGQMKM